MSGWEELVEWYRSEFREAFLYFDSWADLKAMVNDPDTAKATDSRRPLAKKAMLAVRATSLKQWDKLLGER